MLECMSMHAYINVTLFTCVIFLALDRLDASHWNGLECLTKFYQALQSICGI